MQEKEFYQRILGLTSPWYVSEVKLDMANQQVNVEVAHPEGTKFCCPECGAELDCYDHSSPRTWRHLDTMQFRTMLHAEVPRVDCPEHGFLQTNVPWADPKSRFTLLFERFAIDLLLAIQNVKGAQTILKTGWEQTWHILTRAVERGRVRKSALPMPRIDFDEKSFAKGQNYITLLYDLDRSTVKAISDGCDVGAALAKSAMVNIPLAEEKIVHDRFHVMTLATEAVD